MGLLLTLQLLSNALLTFWFWRRSSADLTMTICVCIYLCMCFLLQDALHVEWKMDSEFIMQIHSKKKRNKVKCLIILPC